MPMILKTMDGNKFEITDKEFQEMNNTTGNLVHFRSINAVINKSRIESIFPKERANEVEQGRKDGIFYTADGEKGKWLFGEFVTLDSTPDNMVRYDLEHYPEVARDRLFTAKEFKEVHGLTTAERRTLLIGSIDEVRKVVNGRSEFESVSNLIGKQNAKI